MFICAILCATLFATKYFYDKTQENEVTINRLSLEIKKNSSTIQQLKNNEKIVTQTVEKIKYVTKNIEKIKVVPNDKECVPQEFVNSYNAVN